MRKQSKFIEFLVITFATAIVAASVYFFILPSHVSVGSISSLCMVLNNFIPLPISVLNMILNVALLVISFFFLGKDFGGKTVYTSLLMPVFLGLYEMLFPNQQSLTQDPFVDMFCYIFLVSIGLAVLFLRNASSGGLDIVAKLMNKYLHMELGKAMSLSGMIAAAVAIFAYEPKLVIIGILGTYLNGLVLDHFLFGMNVKKRVCIISEKQEEIKRFIIDTLHSGATIYDAIGAYRNAPKQEIVTIVDKNEYAALMRFIRKTDAKAFVTVYTVNEICYQPK